MSRAREELDQEAVHHVPWSGMCLGLGMRVRRQVPSDLQAVIEVHADAFIGMPYSSLDATGRPIEAALVERLAAYDDLVLPCCFIAEEDDQVVGHVAVSRAYFDDGTPTGRPLLALGPIGVLRSRHNQGVGSALMQAALGAADALDEEAIVLLGHPEYYPRFGFVRATDLGVQPSDPAWIGDSFMIRTLTQWRGGAGTFHFADTFSEPPR